MICLTISMIFLRKIMMRTNTPSSCRTTGMSSRSSPFCSNNALRRRLAPGGLSTGTPAHCSCTHVYYVKHNTADTDVCLSVCWSRSWAIQKRLNRSRCRLGVVDMRHLHGPRNHVLDGSRDPLTGRGNFWGCSCN